MKLHEVLNWNFLGY